MNRIASFLALLLMIFSFGESNAITFWVEASPQIAPDTLKAGVPFTVDIYMDNNDGFSHNGYSWPLYFYSPDLSITSAIHVNVSGYPVFDWRGQDALPDSSILELHGFDTFWDIINAWYGFSWDGVLPDTINHSPAGLTGWPSGLGEQLYVQFTFEIDEPGTFCIDSCSVPGVVPPGKFDWLFEPEGSSYPFNGPYCWEIEHIPPRLLSTTPTQNELNVPVNTDVSVTFNTEMDETTINSSSFVVNATSTGLHQGVISYDGPTKTVTLNPSRDFAVGEVVTAVLTTDVKSSAGKSLASSYIWSFTVEVTGGSSVFATNIDYPIGTEIIAIYAADLDGDGDIDLVTGNNDADSVSVLTNNGDGTFAIDSTYSVGNYPVSISAADFDSDGNMDIVSANYWSDDVSVLLNLGDGTFGPQSVYSAGDYPRSPFPADLDGDGDIDLAVSNSHDSTVSVLLNDGDANFAPQTVFSAGDGPLAVCAADLDSDGDLDLAAPNFNDRTISVFLNNGDGTFALQTVYPVDGGILYILAADLDGDGDLDLAANGHVLLNNGDGTFGASSYYQHAGTSPVAVDLDNDGDLDMASGRNHVPGSVYIQLNNEDGSFAYYTSYPAGDWVMGCTAGDLDADGDIDLATANSVSDDVSILLNQHIPGPLIIVAYSPVNLTVTDPNGYYIGKDSLGNLYQTLFPATYDEIVNDSITISNPLLGEYLIEVVKEEGVLPKAVYSLGIRIDGSLEQFPVQNAPVPEYGAVDSTGYEMRSYICGDADGSLIVNLLDITDLISYLYKGGPAPNPLEAGDANGDGTINLLDITYLINYLYKGGPDPVCP